MCCWVVTFSAIFADLDASLIFCAEKSIFRVRQNAIDPDQIQYTWTSQVVTTSRKFGRDRPILGKMRSGTSPTKHEFFCVVIHATFRQLRNGRFSPHLSAKHSSVSRRCIRKDIFKNFHFRGYLPQKNLKSKINQTATSLRVGYRSRDAL